MSKTKEKYIAVLSAGIDVEYNDAMLAAVKKLAPQHSFRLLYFNSFSSLYYYEKHDVGESNIYHLINYDMIDGIIMLSETIKTDAVRNEIVEKAKAHSVPVVSIDHPLEGCFNIEFKYQNAMEEIVEHLITEHHCKVIDFMAGMQDNSFSDDRIIAYKNVLTKHGIPVEEERIFYGGFWSVPTNEAIDKLLKRDIPFPEAIVCANDSMAIATIKRLIKEGYRVPEDVLVTGFDGIREALEHYPSITTAKHDYEKTIETALDILDNYFAGEKLQSRYYVDSKVVYQASCGCKESDRWQGSKLTRELYERIDGFERFFRDQIALAADLTDNDNFQGVFDNLKQYADSFGSNKFWLCIVDDFLTQKENLSDIIEEVNFQRRGYSNAMDMMLARNGDEWLGLLDFNTEDMLPDLEQILEENGNVMFVPLHVLEQTIGYVAMVYEPEHIDMYHAYQFFMSVSNALENTRVHQRQKSIIQNLEVKYVHDPMTGLFNRRGFYQSMEKIYEQSIQEEKKLMVASVDLNSLKEINDTYGHADGDIAISTIGRALNDVSSGRFVCARFGGDEFVVSGQIESSEEAERFSEDVKQYLEDFNEVSDKPYQVSSSLGIVVGVPNKDISLDEFIKMADEKMYEDKVRYHSRSRL